MKMHNLNTTGWNSFPFEANGMKFVSKIAPNSPFMSKIAMLPAGVFESMNRGAVRDCVGNGLSREEIVTRLYAINENASHAILELAE
jgi:hypothetical protein